MTFKLTYT